MIEVEAPDGTIVEFPDGTSPEVIRAKMRGLTARAPQAQPAPTPQPEVRNAPSNWERFSRHVGEGFHDTVLGGITNIGQSRSGDQVQVDSLTNQKKALEATPAIFGGPNQSRLQAINEQLEALNKTKSDSQLIAEQAKNKEAERKKAYENMPPAQGLVENTVAVLGHVLGSMASPESLIPVPLTKAAPVAVRAGATLLEKMAARAPETAKAAAKAGAAVGATNAAFDPAIQSMHGEEYDPSQTAMKAAMGFAGGALLRGAIGAFTDPTVPRLRYPSDADVLANRADRKAAEEAGKVANANRISVMERIRTEIQDAGLPLRRLQRDSAELNTILDAPTSRLANPNTRLTPADEYQLLKASANQVEYAVMHGTFHFSPDGQSIVPTGQVGLQGILSPLKGDANRFLEYIAALRADFMERNRGMTSGFDPKRTASILYDHDNNPAFQVARDSYRQFTDWVLDFKKNAGIYSDTDVSTIKQWNPDFIPFYRLNEDDGLPKALSSVGKDKKLRGSGELSADLVGNLSTYVNRSIVAANKNRFRQTLYDWVDGLALTDPDVAASWAIKQPKLAVPLNLPENRLRAELLKMPGIQNDPLLTAVVNQLPLHDMKLFYMRQIGLGEGSGYDVVYRNGVAEVYKLVDPGLMRSLEALTPRQLAISRWTLENMRVNRFLKTYFNHEPGPVYNWLNENLTLGSAKTGFTKIITMNPGFAMVGNPIRDALNAFVTSKQPTKDIIPLYAQIKSAHEMMVKNPDYQEYILNGGGYSGIIETEAKSGLNKLYIKSGVDPFKDVINNTESLWGLYKELIQRVEHVTRFAEYQGLRKSGASPRAAALAGRNVSVDFGKEGANELIRNLNASIPFLNTMLQSTAREVESLSVPNARDIAAGADRSKAKRLLAGAGGLMSVAISAWAYNQAFHKEDYDINLADFIKDTHIVFGYKPEWLGMEGDGHSKFITIPIPYGIGFTFAGIPVRLMESMQQGTIQPVARSVGNYFKSVANISENPIIATGEAGLQMLGVLDPKNARTFTGAPVIPKGLEAKDALAQERPSTATWAVDAGWAMGTSPVMTEYFVRQYLSGLTDVAAFLYDNITDRREALGRGTKPAPNIQDMPMIGRLIKDAPTKYNQDDEKLHAAMKHIQQEMNTMGLQKTRFNFDKLYERLAERNPKYGALKGANMSVQTVNDNINNLERMADAIYTAPDYIFINEIKSKNKGITTEDAVKLIPKEKRRQLNELYYERNMILHEAITQLEQDPSLRKIMNPRGFGAMVKSLTTGRPYAEGGLVTKYESTGSGFLDWLLGSRKKEEPVPITAVTDQPYPDDSTVEFARKVGFGYGTGNENFLEPGKGKMAQSKELPSSSIEKNMEIFQKMKPTPVTKDVADSNMKAQLANTRGALAALGYDPRKTGVALEKQGELSINGAYNPKRDQMANFTNNPSTYNHEAIHRALKNLKDNGIIKENSEGTIYLTSNPRTFADEESLVRRFMQKNMGDPEVGEVADKARKRFNKPDNAIERTSNRQTDDLIAILEKEAAKLVKQRRPGGPR